MLLPLANRPSTIECSREGYSAVKTCEKLVKGSIYLPSRILKLPVDAVPAALSREFFGSARLNNPAGTHDMHFVGVKDAGETVIYGDDGAILTGLKYLIDIRLTYYLKFPGYQQRISRVSSYHWDR